jgi:16S rRNA (guanine527-N7)-methyltransferase
VVDELVVRLELPVSAGDRLEALLELVASDPHAPTTVRDRRRIADDHLADSLVALELPPVRAARRIADLGSGAGFPGLPLAIALPAVPAVLLESSGRKCAFLQRAVSASRAENATVIHGRAEEWSPELDRPDLVTARALAPLPVVVEYAAPLLEVGGTLVVWRGRRDAKAEAEAETAALLLGMEPHPPTRVLPYPRAEHRYLHLFSKVRETPPGFPRRPGIALKRPLGA